jgi:hypothetical protein
MSKPIQQAYVVLDAQVLELGLIDDVFRMLGYFIDPTNSPDKLRERGFITVAVTHIENHPATASIGPTISLKNSPRDVQLTVPTSYIRCVLEVPDTTQFEHDRFALGKSRVVGPSST